MKKGDPLAEWGFNNFERAKSIAPDIPNHKFQIPNKLRIPISNDTNAPHPALSPWGRRKG